MQIKEYIKTGHYIYNNNNIKPQNLTLLILCYELFIIVFLKDWEHN